MYTLRGCCRYAMLMMPCRQALLLTPLLPLLMLMLMLLLLIYAAYADSAMITPLIRHIFAAAAITLLLPPLLFSLIDAAAPLRLPCHDALMITPLLMLFTRERAEAARQLCAIRQRA